MCIFKGKKLYKGGANCFFKRHIFTIKANYFQVRIIFLGSVYVLLKMEELKSQTGNSDQFPYGHLFRIVLKYLWNFKSKEILQIPAQGRGR